MRQQFTIDTTGWTQLQKNTVVPAAVQLVSASGAVNFSVEQPFNGTDIFVTSDTIIDPSVLTTQTVLAKVQEFEARWEAERLAREAIENQANNEILGNAIQTMTLDEVMTWIDNQYAPIETALAAASNLAQAKAAVSDFMALDKAIKKKIAKYIIAKEIQRGQR